MRLDSGRCLSSHAAAMSLNGTGTQEMLLELRTYDFAPGDADRYLQLFARAGLPLITRHLPLVGYWVTEIGPLNRIRHMWAYRDMAERAERRGRLLSDAEWMKSFVPVAMPLIRNQESQLLSQIHASREAEDVLQGAARAHAAPPTLSLHLDEFLHLTAESTESRESNPVLSGEVICGRGCGSRLSLHTPRDFASEPSTLGADELLRRLAFSPL